MYFDPICYICDIVICIVGILVGIGDCWYWPVFWPIVIPNTNLVVHYWWRLLMGQWRYDVVIHWYCWGGILMTYLRICCCSVSWCWRHSVCDRYLTPVIFIWRCWPTSPIVTLLTVIPHFMLTGIYDVDCWPIDCDPARCWPTLYSLLLPVIHLWPVGGNDRLTPGWVTLIFGLHHTFALQLLFLF